MPTNYYLDSNILFNCDLLTSIRHESEKSSLHFHNRVEIIIVEKGSCEFIISKNEYHATEGQAIFICPFQIHAFNVGKSSSVRQIILDDALILTTLNILEGRVPTHPIFNVDPSVLKLTLEKLSEFFGKSSGPIKRITPLSTRISVKGMLYMLCGELLSQTSLSESKKPNDLAIEIIEYISKNFRKDISLHDIAKQRGYNYQYISRTFNRTMNIPFKKVLNQYRMQYAYYALQDTNLPISTVCFESGFQSIRSFNDACIEIFGMTPKELRRTRTRY